MAVLVPHVFVRYLVTAGTREHVAFGSLDKRGREVGAIIVRRSLTVELAPNQAETWGYLASTELPVGTFRFVFLPQATRDGKAFGACQPNSYFETEEAREAAIAKYLAGAKKRAAKIAARAKSMGGAS